MAEDSVGRIWMGSVQSGLAMFNPKTDEYSLIGKDVLASDSILRLVTDKYNHIWVGTPKGITIINPDAATYSRPEIKDGISEQRVTSMTMDKEQRLWISHGNSFDIADLDNKTIATIKNIPGMQVYKFDGMFCDSKDNIWLASLTDGYMNAVDIHRHQLYIFHDIPPKQTNVVTGLSEDVYGHILLSGLTGVRIFDIAGRSLKDITVFKFDNFVNNKIIQNITDKNGNTWLATSLGLYIYKQNPLLEEHIGDLNISTICMDSKGVIYAGSNKGLVLIDRTQKTMRTLGLKGGLVDDNIQNVVSLPDGRIDIGTNGGFSIIDNSHRHIENFKGPVWYANITDHTGKLWICGRDGIDIYDQQKKTITHLGTENGITACTDIMVDNLDNIWLTKRDGTFSIIDAQRKTIQELDLHLTPPGNTLTTVILHDGTSANRWIGTPKGLFIIDPAKKTALQFAVPQGLADETVISLLKRGDTVYAGTNKGVSVITMSGKGAGALKTVSFGREFGLEKINVGYWLTDNFTNDGKYMWGDKGISILNLAGNMHHIEPDVYISSFNLMDEPAYFTTPVNGNGDSTLKYNTSGKVLGPYNLPANLEIPYHESSLQFSFTSHSTFKADTTWYRYMLTGTDKTWRKKTSETTTGNYYNLSPGWYTFKVEATANDGTWGKPAVFNFQVLPPWWQTWWARILFVLLFAGLIWMIVYYRSLSLIRSKKLLEQKVAMRTQEVLEQKEEISAQRDSLEQTVTELKQTQSQLIQSEKMASLGELTAGIAHEIQNPLNFVNNFSEVNAELIDEMQQEIANGNLDEVKAIATDIQENEKKINMHGKRADAIVKGMLQHSRAGSGEKEPTNINKLADEYLRLSYHGLRAKDKSFNAEMVTHFDDKLPLVNILPQEVGRVLLNLFNNAFYAVSQKKKAASADYKPTVTVSTSLDGDQVVITVKDNGMGIPDAVKDKIMQPFFTTKPTGEGTGLGLSLSYDIVVKGHSGEILVNNSVGGGAEFVIKLPL